MKGENGNDRQDVSPIMFKALWRNEVQITERKLIIPSLGTWIDDIARPSFFDPSYALKCECRSCR